MNVSNNVVIGDRCKIQNNVSLYDGVGLEERCSADPPVSSQECA